MTALEKSRLKTACLAVCSVALLVFCVVLAGRLYEDTQLVRQLGEQDVQGASSLSEESIVQGYLGQLPEGCSVTAQSEEYGVAQLEYAGNAQEAASFIETRMAACGMALSLSEDAYESGVSIRTYVRDEGEGREFLFVCVQEMQDVCSVLLRSYTKGV